MSPLRIRPVLSICASLALFAAPPARADENAVAAAAAKPVPHIREGGEAERRLHLSVDAAATYGIGGQMALGAQVHAVGYTALWNTRAATGSFDLGLKLVYENEPTFLAPWVDTSKVRGAGHRVNALVTVGHTFHLGARRRASLGIHLFGGLNHWISAYSLDYPSEGVSGSAVVSRSHFIAGGDLKFAYRLSRHVGVHLFAGGPFPFQSDYVVGMFRVGAGLTFYAR